MRRPLPLFLPLLAALLLGGPLSAVPLEIVEVSAPAINCVFDGDCRITVNDSTAAITLPAATGEGFLQSRTAPPGEAGTTGEGFVPYEYRIDLRPIGGLTALPCITKLSLDFGDHQPLDYDGDGDPEDVFVVTGGGLGSIGLASADRTDDRITFRFAPAVCAGNRPGAGESSFFFGLAGSAPPRPVTAQATLSLGGTLDLAARAPGAEGGGAAPPIAESCFPGLPIRADVPVCRCLRDATLRELRCGVFHPDFYLVRRTPLPIPPGRSFSVSWTLVPREDFSGTVMVEEGLAPGFRNSQGSPRMKLQSADARKKSATGEYRLQTSVAEGTLSVPSLVTVLPGRGGKTESFQLLLPIGPDAWPTLVDVLPEPRIPIPVASDFGPGPCGDAARELWNEHVERFGGTFFGLSYAESKDLRIRAERCRRAMPRYEGECRGRAEAAWAACFLRHGRACAEVAADVLEECE